MLKTKFFRTITVNDLTYKKKKKKKKNLTGLVLKKNLFIYLFCFCVYC